MDYFEGLRWTLRLWAREKNGLETRSRGEWGGLNNQERRVTVCLQMSSIEAVGGS